VRRIYILILGLRGSRVTGIFYLLVNPYLWGKMDKDLCNKTSLHEFKNAVWAINLTDVLDGRCSCYACST